MYLGLSLALLALGVKFFQEVLHSLAGIETQGRRLHRRHLLDTPAAHLHERASHTERQDPLVRRVTSDIRRIGSPARRSRPDGFRVPPGPIEIGKFPRPTPRRSHLATRH